ncbi:MAG: CpsD/CapB family tyrosine-protein kinase [Desulfobacteraceae bacterium]|jgi:non-specific protein-tyrosine kinase
MSRIRKALERSKALREKKSSDLTRLIDNGDVTQFTDSSDNALTTSNDSGDVALSEREQLEHDIIELLRKESPEILESRQKQIRLSYSKTKTIDADLETLLYNRVFAHKSEFLVTEQIEILRFQVLKKLGQLNANSLMITSATPGEGKTFISTNLAVSIAQNLDRTVMLIDADLRSRTRRYQDVANIFFNSYDGAGLSDYLQGSARISEVLINPGIPRLTLLPRGQGLLDSPTLLESAKMEELVGEMKSRYSNERIILFDGSAFLPNADALILSRFVDAVLVVVESEKIRADALKKMIDLLKEPKIIGTVMNKTR